MVKSLIAVAVSEHFSLRLALNVVIYHLRCNAKAYIAHRKAALR